MRLYLNLTLAALAMIFAFLWYRAREAAGDLRMKEQIRERSNDIEEKKKNTEAAKADFLKSLNHFNKLYREYQRRQSRD